MGLTQPKFVRSSALWCIIFLSIFIGSCTNSKLVLRPLYNSLDNRFEKRFLAYTEFDKKQTSTIRKLVDHFHVWHRQTQLPLYALFLEEVVSKMQASEVTETDVKRWSSLIKDYRSNLGSCSPFYGSAAVLATLDQQQIDSILTHRKEQIKRWEDDDDDSTEADPDGVLAKSVDKRVKQISRYLSLIGLNLNSEQKADLGATMNATQQFDVPMREHIKKLDDELFSLLDQREESNWEETLIDYINHRRKTISNLRNEERVYRTAEWEAYAVRAFSSLDNEQQRQVRRYLAGLASTLHALSTDQPSAKDLKGSEYRCLGDITS